MATDRLRCQKTCFLGAAPATPSKLTRRLTAKQRQKLAPRQARVRRQASRPFLCTGRHMLAEIARAMLSLCARSPLGGLLPTLHTSASCECRRPHVVERRTCGVRTSLYVWGTYECRKTSR